MARSEDNIHDLLTALDKSSQNNFDPGSETEIFHLLDECLDVGVSILDADLNYIYLNQSFYRQFDLTEKDIKCGDPLQVSQKLMVQKGLITEDAPIENEYEHKDKEFPARLIRFKDGRRMKIVRKRLPGNRLATLISDVTELVKKSQMLRKALALGQAGYWAYNLTTRKYSFSDTMKAMYSDALQSHIREKGILVLIHPDDRASCIETLKSAHKNNGRFETLNRILFGDGCYHWCRTHGIMIFDENGKPTQVQAFVKDVTQYRQQAVELEAAKDEAIAASKAKSEFLANMSHEIRTPMNGVLGMAELLANTDIDERQREFVKVITQSSTALLTIINDILDFSKIEAGALELDPIPFNLKDSVNDVATLMIPNSQEKGIELVVNYPSSLPAHFIGDAGRIRQILTNLVGNAIKFTSEGHVIIDLDITQEGDNICRVNIDVSDTGIGIEKDKLSAVFNKFTQADGSTTRIYGGTGLGLSIVKHLTELMGGKTSVKSVFGEGSTFGISIPLSIDHNAQVEPFDTANFIGKRALIIDDIAVNRHLLTERMQLWKMFSETAENGVEAITQIKKAQAENTPFDLILLDYLMPGMNGLELAKVLKNDHSIPNIPTIMLSSVDQSLSTQEFKDIGIDAYLTKPVRENRLFEAINTALIDAQGTAQNAEEDARQPALPPAVQDKTDILVAEDFPLNQDVIRLMLADTHFNPVFASNGQEAVTAFTAEPDRFALILMDVSMPVMDGYDATQAIRDLETSENRTPINIIALTGHALKHDRQLCLDAGMDDYLTKPIKQTVLIERLEHYSQSPPNRTKLFA